jgi:hydroxymethylbilane synthase
MSRALLRLGTRGSALALWQARWVKTRLEELHGGLAVELAVIKTSGDRILDSPLSKIGDKGLFTREIEAALLAGEIDLAVHSLKDLPTELPEGLKIGAVTERADVRDAFIPHPANPRTNLRDQLQEARIATGSLRRKSQLAALRPDYSIVDIRGNLNTRLRKLEESDWAGMVLARAGVVRLGLESRIGETIPVELMLPAVGQGALAVEIRSDDAETGELISGLSDPGTERGTAAERSLLRSLEGGCQVPIGAFGRLALDEQGNARLHLDAMVGSLDGSRIVRGTVEGPPAEAELLGARLAEELLSRGAQAILSEIRRVSS